MINSNITQIQREKKWQIKQKTAVVFSKAFSVIDVISAVIFTKKTIDLYSSISKRIRKLDHKWFPDNNNNETKKRMSALFLCVSLLVWVLV